MDRQSAQRESDDRVEAAVIEQYLSLPTITEKDHEQVIAAVRRRLRVERAKDIIASFTGGEVHEWYSVADVPSGWEYQRPQCSHLVIIPECYEGQGNWFRQLPVHEWPLKANTYVRCLHWRLMPGVYGPPPPIVGKVLRCFVNAWYGVPPYLAVRVLEKGKSAVHTWPCISWEPIPYRVYRKTKPHRSRHS
jgi:hypothetical protein